MRTLPQLLTAAGTAAVLTACGTAAAVTVHRGDAYSARPGSLTAADVAARQTAFGVDLVHAVCTDAADQNLLLSPTSAAEALGLLYPATAGTTAGNVGRVLHLPPWSPDLVAAVQEHTRALGDLHHDGDLDDDDAPDALLMSNRLWTATVAVLPPEDVDPCAVDTTALAALDDASAEQVGVRLPQMEIEQTHDLLDVLEGMGLPLRGDFSGLGQDGLEITDVVQKTYLKVDEEGTEAAAATGVAVGEAAAPVPERVVTFDRPFLFLLIDTATRSPLFATVVADPSR